MRERGGLGRFRMLSLLLLSVKEVKVIEGKQKEREREIISCCLLISKDNQKKANKGYGRRLAS